MVPLIGFTVLYHYLIGPWDLAFARIDLAFLNIVRLFLGNWPTKNESFLIVPIAYFLIYQTLFQVWKTLVISLQIINLKEVLATSRTKTLSSASVKKAKEK